MRKFYVWLISLGAVLTAYLLYNQLSKTPRIKIETQKRSAGSVTEFDSGKVGKVGDVGVGAVRKAKYTHLNEQRQVDREWGFEKLLYEKGKEWELEKPFIDIFRRNFKCSITADKGNVLLESGVKTPSPKDGTLTGNVVIHITPHGDSDIKESFIYLDDIIYISEKSQFSTAGPVKFVSENAQMLGTGMELIYNTELDRLEFLRIINLESLHIKTLSKASLLRPAKADVGSQAEAGSQADAQVLAEPAKAGDTRQTKPLPTASKQTIEQAEEKRYRCIFSKNVVIDSPEQLVFADEVFINNIISGGRAAKADTGGTDNVTTSQDVTEGTARLESTEPDTVETNDVKLTDAAVTKKGEPDEPSEQLTDIVVTCDNGIFVTPMDSVEVYGSSAKLEPEAATEDKNAKNLGDAGERTTFVAQRIDYDYGASTSDIVASGPLELTFYADDVMGGEANDVTVPVKITARRKAKFLPALNQVIFEGDCLCTMVRENSSIQQKYTLSAPKLTINLSEDNSEQSSASATGIEHLTADGGLVRLSTLKTRGEELLGGIELKCRQFDFDNGQQTFVATGPGVIIVDNSKISEPDTEMGRFSLRKPCWVVVRNFDILKYYVEANQIVADNRSQRVLIDYFPIVEGQYAEQVSVSAGRIEADIIEKAGGRNELSTLVATGGISYEDADKQFEGSEMFYDANDSVIKAWGNESQPCLFNGMLVDGLEHDLKTDKVKIGKIIGGVLQEKR